MWTTNKPDNVIKVLHVDDNLDDLIVSKRHIERFEPRIQITSLSSHKDVLNHVESYSCILLDFRMPQENGIELAIKIREISDVPIILYTGEGSEEVASESFEVGINDYIRKEFEDSHYQVLVKRIIAAVEKHSLERTLIDNEAMFRGIAERSIDIIFTLDRKGTITYISPAVEKVGGYKPEEVIGNSFRKYITGSDLSTAVHAFIKSIRGFNIERLELELIDADGIHIPVEINASPITIGDSVIGTQGIIRDISERKRLEEEVQARAVLFELAPDAMYLNDLAGNFVDGNLAAERITGYSRDELIGKNFFKLNLLSASQIPKAAVLLAKNVSGLPTGPDVLTLNRKDGKQIEVEILTYPLKIKGKGLVLGIARDISSRHSHVTVSGDLRV
ncbi:MAG: PAS domain S-box protein [Candidatus Bathyarchaeia archaeon]